MSRPAKPWYRKDRDQWCVYVKGELVKLVKGKANRNEAYRRFLMLTSGTSDSPIPTARLTSKELCSLFVIHAQSTLKPNSAKFYKQFLDEFGEHAGMMDANAMSPLVVTTYIETHKDWGANTRAGAIKSIKRAWNWAAEEGRITNNNIQKVKLPRPVRRESIPDDKDFIKLVNTAEPHIKEVLVFLYLTGCRPTEAAMIERRHISLQNREIRFKIGEDKTSGKTNKRRVIHLSDAALAHVKKIMDRGEPGTLFKNTKGKAWTRYSIAKAVQRTRGRVKGGVSDDCIPYAFRHHWATDAIARGVSISSVAEMMGNSPAVVASTYSHLSDRKSILIEGANMARKVDPFAESTEK